MLLRSCSKFCILGYSTMWTKNFQTSNLGLEKTEEPEIKLLEHRENKGIPEKHVPLFHWLCYSLWLCVVLCLVTQSCPTLCDPMDCSPPGSSVHGDSPGKNIRVGCLAFLQGIFPTPCIKYTRSSTLQADSLSSEPPESPRILEWVAYPFSRGSSQPRNQTGISCIAGRFFTSWVTREALNISRNTHLEKDIFIQFGWKWSHLTEPCHKQHRQVQTSRLESFPSL